MSLHINSKFKKYVRPVTVLLVVLITCISIVSVCTEMQDGNNTSDASVIGTKVYFYVGGSTPVDCWVIADTNQVKVGSYDGQTSAIAQTYAGAVDIPSTFSYNSETYTVVKVESCAFKNCSNITSITVPQTVGLIGYSAFYGCSGLTSLTIPTGVTSIGDSTFYGCSGLTSLTIPTGVTSIGASAFYGCSKIASLIIPTGVTSILDSTFYGCTALSSITIPTGLTSIGASAFYNCSVLTSLTIPTGVTSIKDSTFYNCSGLTSLTIPTGVTSIGASAFYKCSGLTSLTIPTGVTSIGDSAFRSCSSVTSFTIPTGVTSIGYAVFYSCSSVTSFTILSNLTSIGDSSFGACGSLLSIDIPSSVTSIGPSAFAGCISLNDITIPTGVTSIAASTFSDCRSITSLAIPAGVTSIGASAFYKCSKITSLTIPTGVTSIKDSTFYNCSGLTSLTILGNITSIGASAFFGCSKITSLTISGSATSVGDSAFNGCTNLTSLTIPTGVTSIGASAFRWCSSLTSFTIPAGVTLILDSTFQGCTALTSITIPTPVTSIGASAFNGCSSLTSFTIPTNVTSIGASAFNGCIGFTSIDIPVSVGSVGSSAFTGCNSLTSITIPDRVASVRSCGFEKVVSVTVTFSSPTTGITTGGVIDTCFDFSSWRICSLSGTTDVIDLKLKTSEEIVPTSEIFGLLNHNLTYIYDGDSVLYKYVGGQWRTLCEITVNSTNVNVSLTTGSTVYSGYDLTFTAVKYSGFDNYRVSVEATVGSNTYTIDPNSSDVCTLPATYVTGDVTITAFLIRTYTLTGNVEGGGSATNGNQVVDTGHSSVAMVFTAFEHYHVSSYSINGVIVPVTGESTTTWTFEAVSSVLKDYVVVVNFSGDTYNVTKSQGTGTTITSTTPAAYGTNYTFTAVKNTGYTQGTLAVSVTIGGSPYTLGSPTGDTYTIAGTSILGAVVITTASIVPNTYTVTKVQGTGTTITFTTSATYGTDYTFTAVKNTGYDQGTLAVSVKIGGVTYALGSPTGDTYTIAGTSILGAVVITTTDIAPNTYTVTKVQGTGTTITFTTPATYGTDYTFTAVKNTGYDQGTLSVSVKIGGTAYTLGSPTGDTYTIAGTSILGAVVITTTDIAPNTYTVTKVQGTGTTITFTTPATYGTDYTFTAVKNTGYDQGTLAVSVKIGGVTYALGSPTGDTYTITGTSILGAVVITTTDIAPNTYTVTKVQGTGTTITFTTPATYGTDYTFTAVKNTGYDQGTLSVSVKIGGVTYALGSPTGDTYTITGTSILGAVVITTTDIAPNTYTVTKVQGTGTTITFTTPATYGTDYTFTAVKNTGYDQGTLAVSVKIGGVTYALGSPTGDTYTITGTSILGAVVITTTDIAPNTYTVTKVQGTGTTITFTTPATYGTDYTFTAVKNTGYDQGTLAVSVKIGGTAYTLGSPTGDTYTITGTSILGAVVITTTDIAPNTYTVTKVQGTGTTITFTTPATYGTDYTFTAVKNTGYDQGTLGVSVTIGGVTYALGSPTGDTYTITGTSILGAVVITTTDIAPNTYTVTKVQGTGTTITFTTPATYGTDYTFTAVKDTGYTQGTLSVSVKIGGVTYALGSPTGDTYTITGTSILGAVVITTTDIAPNTYTVTKVQGTGTTITFTTPATYGTDYTFTAVKNTGYDQGTLAVSVKIGGVTYALGSPTGDTYTITGTSILGAVVITTTDIAPNTYTVTKVQGTGTTITFTTPATYGTDYTFTAVKDTGYTQGTLSVSVKIGGVTYALGSPTGDTYTITGTSILGAVVITTTDIAPNTYTVTKVQGTGTTITFTTPATYGTDYTFTAVKNTGYDQGTLSVSVKIGGVTYALGSPTGDTYTITGTSILGAVVITTGDLDLNIYTVSGTLTVTGGTASNEGVTITLDTTGTDYTAVTMAGGAYTISSVPYGTSGNITAAITGYNQTVISSVTALAANATGKNLTLTINQYTVSFDGNGSTSGSMPQMSMTYGTEYVLTSNAFFKSGSAFIGWSLSDSATIPTYSNRDSVVNLTAVSGGNVILYAVWEDSKYTVEFNGNGGTGYMPDQYLSSGAAVQIDVCAYSFAGKAFLGWDTDSSADTVVYTDMQTVKDLVSAGYTEMLYAVWSATGSSYTVTFDGNGGTGYMSDQNFASGEAGILIQNVFAKSGSTFQGWSTALNGPVVYTDGQTVRDIASAGGTVTLYAVWTATGSSYTVTFLGNGGTGYMPIQNFTVGTAKALEQNIYAKTGYTFQGWSLVLNGSVIYTEGQMVKDLASAGGTVTLYAVWSADSYTVTFNGNNGTGCMPIQNFESDVAKSLEQNVFTRSGYTFQGWATVLNGPVIYTDGQKIVVSSSTTLFAVWTATGSSYIVTFNGNGGTGYMPAQNFTVDVAKSLEQNIFVRSGYIFQGWATSSVETEEYNDGQKIVVTADITLYAVWSDATSYIVTFNGNGGTGVMSNQNFTSGPKALMQNIFSMTGYKFQGWSTASDGPVMYTDGQKIVVTADTTLYAVWTVDASSYTVTFLSNGGTGIMFDQYFTSSVAKSLEQNTFVNTGNTFQGWSAVLNGPVVYTDGQTVRDLTSATGTVTLYAVWSATGSSYTVTFDSNNGTGYMPVQNFTSGTAKSLEQNVFSKSGSTFQGWSSTSGGSVLYTDGQTVKDLVSAGGTVTLYAVWSATGSSYTVTFNGNGGTGYMPIQNFTSGAAKALQQNVFSKSGNTFQGWSAVLNGTVIYTDGQIVKDIASAGGTVTLYAVWSSDASSYTVTFNGNGGTGYMPDQNFTAGTAKSLEQNIFVNTGNTFQGWSTVLNGAVVYTDGQKIFVTANTTLFAVWNGIASSYTVTFNAEGGSGMMPNQYLTSGVAKPLEQNIFSKSGNTFQGWSTVLNGTVIYTDGQIVKDIASAGGTVTLYAVWSSDASSYTVTFNGNGGTGYMPAQNFTSGVAKALEQNIFAKTGNTFQGWSTVLNGPVVYTDGQKIVVSSSTTLYAVWTSDASSYTVIFSGNGGTGYMPAQNFTSGTAKSLEQNIFSMTGYTFQGWATVFNGPVVYTDGQKIFVTSNTTLFAIWSATGSSYTVTFLSNGGTGYMPVQKFESDVAKALEQNIFSKSGNTFQGWSTVVDGEVIYLDGQVVLSLVPAGNTVVLYAVWVDSASSYTVIFDNNSGTGYMPAQNFTSGVAKALEQNVFTRSGYTFQGWSTAFDGDVLYSDLQTVFDLASVGGMVTLYAVWADSASSYTVTFNSEGGSGVMPDQYFTSGVAKALEQNKFTRAGRTFVGWSLMPDGAVAYTDGQSVIDISAVGSVVYLYAVWTDAITYEVSFDSNGGTAGFMPDQYFTAEIATALHQNIFAKSDNTFQGWSTVLNGPVVYTDGQKIFITSNTTLFAVWTATGSSYTVTFDSNGGTGYMPIQNFTSGVAKALEQNIFFKSGNTFQGWSTVLNGTVVYTDGQKIVVTANTTLFAVWTVTGSSYIVTFDANGGTGYMPVQNFESDVAKSLEQNLFTRSGYTFQGWSAVSGSAVVYTDGQKIIVESSTTLYAVWTVDGSSYTVTFSSNGGTGYMPVQNFESDVAKSLEQNVFVKSGSTFQGWSTILNGTVVYTDGQKIVVTANTTLFAVWTATGSSYTVTFDANGGTGYMPVQNFTYGVAKALEQNIFVKTDNTFQGWAIVLDGPVVYTDGQKIFVTANTTLFAVWAVDVSSYTTVFDSNGGTGYMPAQNFESGVAKALEQNIFVKDGSTFQGWSIVLNGPVVYTDGQKIVVTANTTLFAVWTATGSSYTVIFDANGGTGYMPAQNFESDVAKSLEQNVFVKSGSTFQGWSTILNGTVVYTDGQKIIVAANTTLFAVWTATGSSYTVTFDANGGTGYMSVQNFTSDAVKALEQNIFSKSGSTFQGWSTVLNGPVVYTDGQKVSVTVNTTLFAVWTATGSSYTVIFDANGGIGYMPVQNFTSGTAKALEQNIFVNSGNTFQGWSTVLNGTVVYTDGQKILVTANTTLFAVWAVNASSYTVVFDGNGGTGYMPVQNFTSGAVKSLEQNIFSKSGSTFQGWSTVLNGTVVYTDGQKILVTANTTLFAVWAVNALSYTVVFDGNGGTGYMPVQNFTSGVAKALEQNVFTRSGYTFQGWAVLPAGDVVFTDGQSVIDMAAAGYSVTLYAVWTSAMSYAITFDGNGGTGYMPVQNFMTGTAKSIQQNIFVKSGNTFQGWSIVLNGPVVYTDGQKIVIESSTTLYAVWVNSSSSYTVTFDSNGGTGYMPVQNFTTGTAKSLEQNIFSKSGNTFQGWSTILNGPLDYTDGQIVKDLASAGSTVVLYAVWTATGSSYTVTFDGNGGTGYMPVQNFTSGVAKALEQNIFAKDGNTFQGWATVFNGPVDYTDGQKIVVTANTTLFAVWAVDISSYTTVFDSNGGTGYMPAQNFESGVAKALEQNIFVKDGSTFQGWSIVLNGPVVYTDGQIVKDLVSANGTVTLYAVWSATGSSYTVTFNGNGGTGYMPVQNFESGVAKALEQNIFAKDGSTFQGWATIFNGDVIYTDGQKITVTANTTLFAVWSATVSSYTVTFDGNSGTGYMPVQNFTSGVAKALEQNIFVKSGSTFQGWSVVLNGPVVYTDGQNTVMTSNTTLFAVWTAIGSSYTVTFDANGGTGYMPVQNFTSGVAKALEQNIFFKSGNTFQGWSTVLNGTVVYTDGQKIVVTANTTLFAVWSATVSSYTVTFDGNGGTGYMPVQNFTSGVAKALEQNIFAKDGSTFQGWATIFNGDVVYTDGQKIVVTANITLFAVWSATVSSYTVTFDGNGGTGYMPVQNFTSGVAKALEQNIFVKSGSTFQGWSAVLNGPVVYTDGQKIVVTANTTLFAVWTATGSSYTVTFDANGGTGYMPVQNFTSGVAKALEQNVFVKTDNTFQGWATVLNGPVVYTDGQKIVVAANITLFAVWSTTVSSYTVTFDANGGTGYMPAQEFESGVAKALEQNIFAKDGSTFQGWATIFNGDVVYTDGQKIVVAANITLFAVWSTTVSSYTVTFDGNGGTGYMPVQNFTTGTAKSIQQNIFYKSGNTFQGWSTVLNGPVVYTDGQIVKDLASAGSTVTFYAVWSATGSSYTVTFDANGGTGYMPAQNFTSGVAKALQQNVFTRSGYTFQGWALASGGPVLYTDGQKIFVTANTTLFAVWAVNASSYTVVFDGNGGTGYMPVQNFESGVAKALEQNIFVKDGSTFQGWSTVLNGPVVYTDGQKIVVTANTTLFAVWAVDVSSYTIVFDGNGGTGYMPAQKFESGVAKALEQNIFVKSGNTFQGWSITSGGSVLCTDGQMIKDLASAGSTVTFYAVWSATGSSYTVTFDANGGTGYMPVQNFESGVAKALGQNTFSKSGNTFQGWSASSGGSVVYANGQKITVTADMTLFAVWAVNASSYTVVFNGNGGTGYMPAQNFTSGTAKALQQNVFINGDYIFRGWSTTSDGDIAYTDGQVVADIATSGSTIVLYAVWRENIIAYDVTFVGNYVESTYSVIISETNGNTYILPDIDPVRRGYYFVGWYTEASGGMQITSSVVVDLSGPITAYARWFPYTDTYTVTFVGNYDGSSYFVSISETNGNTYTLPDVDPARSGYIFAGWYTDNLGGTQITSSTVVNLSASINLYAKWTTTYTVTFDANGGTGYMPDQTLTYGVSQALESNSFTMSGYTFQGWAITSGGDVVYTDGQKVLDIESLGSTVTLYAVWEPNASSELSYTTLLVLSFIGIIGIISVAGAIFYWRRP